MDFFSKCRQGGVLLSRQRRPVEPVKQYRRWTNCKTQAGHTCSFGKERGRFAEDAPRLKCSGEYLDAIRNGGEVGESPGGYSNSGIASRPTMLSIPGKTLRPSPGLSGKSDRQFGSTTSDSAEDRWSFLEPPLIRKPADLQELGGETFCGCNRRCFGSGGFCSEQCTNCLGWSDSFGLRRPSDRPFNSRIRGDLGPCVPKGHGHHRVLECSPAVVEIKEKMLRKKRWPGRGFPCKRLKDSEI